MRALLRSLLGCVVAVCLLGLSSGGAASGAGQAEVGGSDEVVESGLTTPSGSCLRQGATVEAGATSKRGTLNANLECEGAPETRCGGGFAL